MDVLAARILELEAQMAGTNHFIYLFFTPTGNQCLIASHLGADDAGLQLVRRARVWVSVSRWAIEASTRAMARWHELVAIRRSVGVPQVALSGAGAYSSLQ